MTIIKHAIYEDFGDKIIVGLDQYGHPLTWEITFRMSEWASLRIRDNWGGIWRWTSKDAGGYRQWSASQPSSLSPAPFMDEKQCCVGDKRTGNDGKKQFFHSGHPPCWFRVGDGEVYNRVTAWLFVILLFSLALSLVVKYLRSTADDNARKSV